MDQISRLDGVNVTLFGQGVDFVGFGMKADALIPVLANLPDDEIVVVIDSRDVLINNHLQNPTEESIHIVNEFRSNYDQLMSTASSPEAIIISAEAQCCVSALTHIQPGGYYNVDGTRNNYACLSGTPECLWISDEKAQPWEVFMKDVAKARGAHNMDDKYLNAGLMTGTASNLLKVLVDAQIQVDEDDQAVLTDYFYRHPELFLLDYEQSMFGNNRGAFGGHSFEDACTFQQDDSTPLRRLQHKKTYRTPLFIHSPGGFFDCHEYLGEQLGMNVTHSRMIDPRSLSVLDLLNTTNTTSNVVTQPSFQYGGGGGGGGTPGDGLGTILKPPKKPKGLLNRLGLKNKRNRKKKNN